MIDNIALAVSHGLILLAVWRLIGRPDLDDPGAPEPETKAGPTRSLGGLLRSRRGA